MSKRLIRSLKSESYSRSLKYCVLFSFLVWYFTFLLIILFCVDSISCAGNICWQQQGQLSVRRHQLGLTTTFRLTNILFTQNILSSLRPTVVGRGNLEHLRELASLISRPTSITSHCSNHDEQDNLNHPLVFPLVFRFVTLQPICSPV